MRSLLAFSFACVFLISCGDSKTATTNPDSAAPSPTAATEVDSYAYTRGEILSRIDSSEESMLRKLRTLPDFSNAKETKLREIFSDMKQKIQNYKAYSSSDLVNYADSLLNDFEMQIRKGVLNEAASAPIAKVVGKVAMADKDGVCTEEFTKEIRAFGEATLDMATKALGAISRPDANTYLRKLMQDTKDRCEEIVTKYGNDAVCLDEEKQTIRMRDIAAECAKIRVP